MPESKETWWNDTLYPSVRAAARGGDYSPSAMSHFKRKGYERSEQVGTTTPFEFNGVTYKSKAECSRQLDEPYDTILYWANKGYKSYSDVLKGKR